VAALDAQHRLVGTDRQVELDGVPGALVAVAAHVRAVQGSVAGDRDRGA
jgi:hypothetical protein